MMDVSAASALMLSAWLTGNAKAKTMQMTLSRTVKNGGNRQELHEKIRQLSMEAGKNVKVEGKDNNLLELIAADPSFNLTLEELQATMEPSKYVGRAPIQVDKFLANVVNPILEANKEDLGMTAEINV